MKTTLLLFCLLSLRAFAEAPAEGLEAHYYSNAVLSLYELGKPEQLIQGGQISFNGLQGPSPLHLSQYFVDQAAYAVQAQVPGYRALYCPAVQIPSEGEVKLALLPQNPTFYYTVPSFIVGALAIAAGLVVYNQSGGNSFQNGTALVGGGGAVIVLSQLVSLFDVSRLERKLQETNARLKP